MNAPDSQPEPPSDDPQGRAWVEEFLHRRSVRPELTVEEFAATFGSQAERVRRSLLGDPRVDRPSVPLSDSEGTIADTGFASAETLHIAQNPTQSASDEAGLDQSTDAQATEDPERTHPLAPATIASLDHVAELPEPRRFGSYLLLKVLGRGGMGVVFQAEQTGLNRIVAVKMIRAGELASEEDVARFHIEARAAAKIEHPNVVRIYEVGEVDGHHYFSMDFLEGRDLSELLKQGPLAPRRAAHIALQMARAVMAAHDQGFLHRDLKPANLIIDQADHVTVTDFGLAKKLGDEGRGFTQTGAALGTPSYMAPEQAAGRWDALGPTCDVYSMGAVLYAMLTAHPPFRDETLVKTILAVIEEEPPPPRERRRDVDPDLATICMRCLQKAPEERFAKASDFADELERYLAGEPILSRPAGPWRRAWSWLRRMPLVAALMGRRVTEPSLAHRRVQLAILCVAIGFVLFGAAAPLLRWWTYQRMPRRVVIASGQPDGQYDRAAHALADRLQATPGCENAIVTRSAGSFDNAMALAQGRADVGWMQAAAVEGDRLAVITPVYYEPVHVVVRVDADVRSLRELRGRSVCVGLRGSGMNNSAEAVLRALDLDVERRFRHFTDMADDPSIEAALVTTGTANPSLAALMQRGVFRLLPLPSVEEVVKQPAFKLYRIRPSHYPAAGVPEEGLLTAATPAFLACRFDAPAPLVRSCLEWAFPQGPQETEFLRRDEAALWSFMPLHSEARRFFQEQPAPAPAGTTP